MAKNKIKLIDGGMLFLFILWLASTDLGNMKWHSWLAGGMFVLYFVTYAGRRLLKR